MKIVVSGPAAAHSSQTNAQITDPMVLQGLDGLRYDEDLTTNHLYDELLNNISISGGALQIKFLRDTAQLRIVTEYWAPRALTKEELAKLIDDTRGQWSDGIGEACFDEWGSKNGIHLDVAPSGTSDEVTAEQVDDGRPVPKFAHLAKAVWNGKLDIVKQAVAARANLDVRYDGFPAVHAAIIQGFEEMALLLIEGGADVNLVTDHLGDTPLMRSAEMKSPDAGLRIAKALLQQGAKVDIRDRNGETALIKAKKLGKEELARFLAEAPVRKKRWWWPWS